MLIRSHTGVSASPLEPLAHGGDLTAARQMFPDAPEPFIDLSTGNNPHRRVVERVTLLNIADELRPRGGILVVDESFADVAPPGASLAGDIGRGNIVVLRSFGKFYGLAGLRLGFALAAPSLIERLD